ncbi:MAG: Formamidopyrimidine-DNA glycosylase [Candidatus Berkelbacteria bacterium]|nr:Formamidopyrimidine-DNA glycosylase [Candidatus Berkelbacteria bacterium]
MPELPEVETVRRGIISKIKGKKIVNVDVRASKLFFGDAKNIINTRVVDARRVAKVLQIVLDNGYSILIHLKMTGQLVYRLPSEGGRPVEFLGGHPQKAYEQPLPHKHSHIIYTFDDGSKLFFNDLRKFGWNKIIKSVDCDKYLCSSKFGPEPLTKNFTLKYLQSIFNKTNKKIKDVIIDQEKIGGVGNIYSNDALYWAKILPTRSAKTLTDLEIKNLKNSLEKVIKLGIKYGGSSENTYVNFEGKRGKYMEHSSVYQQKKDPRGHDVIRIKFGSRSSFYCPICQM